LVVEENDKENPMQHTEARALFAYRIEGNESTKYVSDLYLEQRVKKMAEDELAKVASAIEEKKGEAKLEEDNEDAKEEKEERKRAGRYF
jgi:anthranilate phosphoribosyltransferase